MPSKTASQPSGSLISSVLDHSSSHGRQLIVVQDSIAQSATGLVREIVTRAQARSDPTLLLCALRQPSAYVSAEPSTSNDRSRIPVLDYTQVIGGYEDLDETFAEGEDVLCLVDTASVSKRLCAEIEKGEHKVGERPRS